MKAIVKYAAGIDGWGMMEVEKPSPAENELLCEVKAVGICGTDIHIIKDEYPHSMPVTMGHEYVATVVGMGDKAEGFAIGDTIVSLACAYTCGKCKYCKSGLDMMCPERRSIGSWRNGAMTKYIVVPAKSCFKVEGEPTLDMAAYEPAACCVRSVVEIGQVTAEDVVLVSGAGFMGQICMQLCKHAGAKVIMSGLPQDAERLALATEMGCDKTATSADEIAKALEELGVDGVTCSFECAAAAPSLGNCVRFSTKHARIVQVGLYGKPIPVDLDTILYKEVQLRTSFGSNPSSWRKTLEIVKENGIKLMPYLKCVVPLSAWEEAFEKVRSGKYYKVIMEIDE